MSKIILETSNYDEVNALYLSLYKLYKYIGDDPEKLKEGINLTYCLVDTTDRIDVEYRSPVTNKVYTLEEMKNAYGRDIFEIKVRI